jgi:hypothetical protein
MRSRASTRIEALGWLFLAMTTAPAQADTVCERPNLVDNGGLERGPGTGGLPKDWSFDSFARTSVPVWDDREAHKGARSVKIISPTPDDSRWIQDVSVQPNARYLLSGWIKTEEVAHSPQAVDRGANISLLGGFTSTPGVLGTQDWTHSQVMFRTQSEHQITVAARLGFYSGITTGTAWFDDIELRPMVALTPHPRWKILVLIYQHMDAAVVDGSGTPHRYVSSMTEDEMRQAANSAKQFATQDVPRLTSGNMLPRIVVRYPDRVLTQLSPVGDGWSPSTDDTAPERDPKFDSVIVLWDPRATDLTTGLPVWIGAAAGLTSGTGTGQTYLAMVIETALSSYGHRNVFKHEWGHSILFFFDAMGTAPMPTVQNHTEEGVYVHCGGGEPYIWQDETNADPIPNSIYHNDSGFTHDYYSGTIATAAEPDRCLGIPASAWALGGPVSHTGNDASLTTAQRIGSTLEQLKALEASGLLDERDRDELKHELELAARAEKRGREDAARASLERFAQQVEQLAQDEKLAPHIANLLQSAASEATDCL